jgi:hypothetical protein
MDNSIENNLQRQYNGFLNTEVLFDKTYESLEFFELNKFLLNNAALPEAFYMPENIRLGQRMEYFMEAALKDSNYEILAKNLQIIHQKKTLGEIDFIVKNRSDNSIFQVEMVYKFYLFDPEVKGKWTQQWIGGNRRDNLHLKLKKLKEKQLPLLYAPETADYLKEIGLKTAEIGQKVCFLGQLFLPYKQKHMWNDRLNPASLAGFWLNKSQLDSIEKNVKQLLIPPKNDWVAAPTRDSENWKSFDAQMPKITALIENEQSTLLWILDNDGVLQRFFLVWWPN